MVHKYFITILFLCFTFVAHGDDSSDIKHVIVIIEENWSFDGLFGLFPGANGIQSAKDSGAPLQVNKSGTVYKYLPQDNSGFIPANLENSPFDLIPYINANLTTPDPLHRFYQEQYQINGGRMDKFVAYSEVGGIAMSYYDVTNMYLGELAKNYTLLDRFHHSGFGGSFLNHQWFVCACTPYWENAPEGARSVVINGTLVVDRVLTPDGYAINTMYSANPPLAAGRNENNTLPSIKNVTTIGDLLIGANVSWSWYAGGYNDAMAGHPDKDFTYHHQPFTYYDQFGNNSEARKIHLKDEEDYFSDLLNGTLPMVSFLKPIGEFNMHPGESTLDAAMMKLQSYVESVRNSKYWDSSLIVIIFDENGGRWDHVAPPKAEDRWGPGTRIPALLVGPFAHKGHIDSTPFETVSVTRYLETHFGVKGSVLPSTRKVNNIADALPKAKSNGLIPKSEKEIIIAVIVVVVAAVVVGVVIVVFRRRQKQRYQTLKATMIN